MPILLFCEYETTSKESTKTVLDSLNIIAQHQISHFKNVLTFHFARPDEQSHPNHIEFTEVYLNESCFWEHGKASHLYEHYSNLYSNEYRKNQQTYAIANWKDKSFLKSTLVKILNPKFPNFNGFIVNSKITNIESGHSSLLLKMEIFTKNLDKIEKEVIEELIDDSSFPLTNVIFKKNQSIFVLQTFPNEENCLNFYQSKKFNFLQGSDDSLIEIYGQLSNENLKNIFLKSPFTKKKFLKTEVGYPVHPQASFFSCSDYTNSFAPKLKKVPSHEKEYLEQVKYWIEAQKLDINEKDKYEKTIMFYACESNFISVVKYLLEKNAKIELKDYQPLCEACHNYSLDLVKLLLDHGADVNVVDYQKNSPLSWILRCGNDDEKMIEIIKLFAQRGLDLSFRDYDGDSYLHLSTRYGHVWATRELIKLGANLELRNNKGNTVLLNCCENSWGWNMNCFRVVFNNKGSIKAKNNEGNTALHIAAKNGLIPLVIFLQSRMNINEKNNYGNTPLHEACLHNRNVSVVQYLIAFGANLELENNANLTPLQLALQNYNLDIVYILLARLKRREVIEKMSNLIPNLSEIDDEMKKKKINLDKIENDFIEYKD